MASGKKSNGGGSNFNEAKKSASEVESLASCKWRFLNALLVDKRLINRDVRVGTRIVQRYIRSDGVAYPGMELLAAELDMSTRTLERALPWLVQCGYFVQGHKGGGKGLANEYAVDWFQYDHAPTKTSTTVSAFKKEKPQTPTALSLNPDTGVVKTPTPVSPPKGKTKRNRKDSRGAASDLAMEPSATASGKKGAQQGNGVSLPIPRLGSKHDVQGPTPAEEKIEQHLSTKCGLGPVQAWGLLIDVPEVALDCIAPRLGSLSKSELLAELKAATLPC